MAFGISAATWAAVTAATAVAATAYTVYSGERAADMQKQAQAEAKAAADKQATLAEEANNKANAKRPDLAAMLSGNQRAAGAGGGAATMLTGPQGVDPSALALGKNTLLGA